MSHFNSVDPDTGAASNAHVSRETSGLQASKASQIVSIGVCWAIEETYAWDVIASLQGLDVVEAARLQAEFDAKDALNAGRTPAPYEIVGNVAVIPVSGPMTKKPTSANFLVNGTSTLQVRSQLRAAKSDKAVDQILMVFETPGGECAGCAELADDIRAVNQTKPITAFVEDACASAGYFAASQCGQIFMNRMGQVGCIGTLMVLEDKSKLAANLGIEVLKFTSEGASAYKGAGVAGTKITDEQKAMFQSMVDHYGNDFKATVQTGRGMTDEQVAAVAIGKMFNADEAMALGLIDGVCSLEECFSSLTPPMSGYRPASTTTATAVIDPARASTEHLAQASGQGTQMALKDIVGRLRGIKPETQAALMAEGIDVNALALQETGSEDAASSAALASLKADMERMKAESDLRNADMDRMKNAALQQMAENFWNSLITPDAEGRAVATWAEKDGVIATFKSLALLDGGGQLVYDANGQFKVGANLQSFIDSTHKRTKNRLQAELIGDGDPNGRSVPGVRMDLIHTGVARRLGKATADKLFPTNGSANGSTNGHRTGGSN